MTTIIRRIVPLAIASACLIGWLSIDREYERSQAIEENITLSETIHVDRRPYTPIGHAGELLVPIPMSEEYVARQRLLYKDSIVWQGPLMDSFAEERYMEVNVSPNREYVLLTPRLNNSPWIFVHLSTGKVAEVPLPSHGVNGHGYGYPFIFSNWENDSMHAIAAVEGSYMKERSLTRYVSRWRISANDGSSVEISRKEEAL
jgi:hypothetical protein